MHPMLKTALRRSWRDRDCLRFGVDPAHAVVLEPLDDPSARFLALLDGTRGPQLLREEATALGLAPDRADRLLDTLAAGGVLDDADGLVGLSAVMRHRGEAIDRLRPDLASLSVVRPRPGAAAATMTARRIARVRVEGAGRVGASLAAVLSAAGIGVVDVSDGGRVEPWDTAPCGIPAARVGDRREAAARGAVRLASPDPRPARRPAGAVRTGSGEPALGLVVLAPRDGLDAYAPDPRTARVLLAAGIPHLYAGVIEGMGVVGPLVVPGRSGCAGCLEAARAEADPAWPRMLAQLRSGRPPGVQACDVALATLVAGLAATHALAFLDQHPPPGSEHAHLGPPGPELRGFTPRADSTPRGTRTNPTPRNGPTSRTAHPPSRAGRTGPARPRANGPGGQGRGGGRGPADPGVGSRTEFSLAGLGMRVFDIPPHAGCACGAAFGSGSATMTG